ncbi:hypothetical protein PV367_32655 [Streptomyces europaeiscabiei]|uniref:Uncharacterized protein n=1 Tax=Streptomyces europaeiscabiei TaxID=146819 RepID=A0AAJ2PVC4_9ACTN|nr:hypothetical protein [Streptomyces europaeiscabiei]MDX3134433.1 hypothetical protein [Streptomyces europaeiscabiei]
MAPDRADAAMTCGFRRLDPLHHLAGRHPEAEARRRRKAEEETAARRRAIEEKERARKKTAKDRAYAAFWDRTRLDRQRWKYFRAIAELFLDRSLVFGAPDPRYGDGRPVHERSGTEASSGR